MTAATLGRAPTGTRLLGVDVARGLALFGMMAVHSFEVFTDSGSPSAATVVAGGRSAATFAFVAGVSLTFLSGGRAGLTGRRRYAAAAGIAVRGLIIGLIGLALGYLGSAEVILPFYGLMFLLAIPLLGLSPRVLALLSLGFAVGGPVLLVIAARHGLSFADIDTSPTLTTAVEDPARLARMLVLTGAYPVVAYLTYVCAGIAVGRLDLASNRVAGRLLAGGLTAAVLAQLVSWILLHPVGGLSRLVAAGGGATGGDGVSAANRFLWEPHQSSSWWYLALASPHANTPLDLIHTTGVAAAVLGGALLLTTRSAAARLLRPVAAAGSMTLTLYGAHLVLLTTGVQDEVPALFLLFMVVAGTGFAVLWRRHHAQGPLERVVAVAASRVRRAAEPRLAPEAPPDRVLDGADRT
jgi:uncharacterized membrane protein YeiB